MTERGGEIQISVRDNGKGFDTGTPSSGFGLTGMRERISLAGGHVEISSSSAGTSLEATVPAERRVRQTA